MTAFSVLAFLLPRIAFDGHIVRPVSLLYLRCKETDLIHFSCAFPSIPESYWKINQCPVLPAKTIFHLLIIRSRAVGIKIRGSS